MKRRRILVVAAGVVILIGITLAFLFPLRELVRTALVEPLIKGYYIASWYVRRLPQLLLWSGLSLLAALFLVRYTVRILGPFSRPRTRWTQTSTPPSELERLTAVIERAHRYPFSRRSLSSELVRLAVRLIARREGLSLDEARERFESFAWCDDPAVEGFFRYRRHYRGFGQGADFKRKLKQTIAFFERYQKGV